MAGPTGHGGTLGAALNDLLRSQWAVCESLR